MVRTLKIGFILVCISIASAGCKTTNSESSSKMLASGNSKVELAIALLDNLSIGECKFTITRKDPKSFKVNFFHKGKLSRILDVNDEPDTKPIYPIFDEDNISYGPSRYLSSISYYNLLTLRFQGAVIYGPLQTRWIEVWFPADGGQPKDARVTSRRIPRGGIPLPGAWPTDEIECHAD